MSGVITRFTRAVLRRRLGRAAIGVAAATAIIGSMVMWQTPSASAHCDSATGPVATAAQEALDTGDVDRVLPYVKPDQEAELTAAFKESMDMRKRGPEAQAFADRYFAETAVRLHRVGEGASYTGLKDEEPNAALDAADTALEQGSLDGVYEFLDAEIREGVEKHYQAVLDARAAEEQNPNVETSRERVEATFAFEKYVLGISEAAHGAGGHEEGATAHTE